MPDYRSRSKGSVLNAVGYDTRAIARDENRRVTVRHVVFHTATTGHAARTVEEAGNLSCGLPGKSYRAGRAIGDDVNRWWVGASTLDPPY